MSFEAAGSHHQFASSGELAEQHQFVFTGANCVYCGRQNRAMPGWFFCSNDCEIAHSAALYAMVAPARGSDVNELQRRCSTAGSATPPPPQMRMVASAAPTAVQCHTVASTTSVGGLSSAASTLWNASLGVGNHGSLAGTRSSSASTSTGSGSAVSGSCDSCGKQCVHGVRCSKRCEWAATGRCPQCGRARGPAHRLFCCVACAGQATQANWCGFCGVRQTPLGAASCTGEACTHALSLTTAAASRSIGAPHHWGAAPAPAGAGAARRVHHQILPRDDRVARNLQQLVSSALTAAEAGASHTVIAVVKIASDHTRRRRYLTYRSTVEGQLEPGAPKHGFGGEGNEQKRYLPVRVECDVAAWASSGVVPCGSPSCEVCAVLAEGFSLETSMCASHYCTTSVASSLPWAQPSETMGVRAIVAARVVVGAPTIVADPSDIAVPADPTRTHSVIVSNGDPQQDGTYLFRDDAIDAQYVVLFV